MACRAIPSSVQSRLPSVTSSLMAELSAFCYLLVLAAPIPWASRYALELGSVRRSRLLTIKELLEDDCLFDTGFQHVVGSLLVLCKLGEGVVSYEERCKRQYQWNSSISKMSTRRRDFPLDLTRDACTHFDPAICLT